jgi:hypothetical protein
MASKLGALIAVMPASYFFDDRQYCWRIAVNFAMPPALLRKTVSAELS